jgi:hypothetical protein
VSIDADIWEFANSPFLPRHLFSLWNSSIHDYANKQNVNQNKTKHLEAIKRPSLALQSIYDIQRCHRLPSRMLSVSNRITDYPLQEVTQNSPDFLIDIAADSLDTTSPRQTANGRFRDSLNVLTHYLSMTLGTTLTQTFTAFASPRHD